MLDSMSTSVSSRDSLGLGIIGTGEIVRMILPALRQLAGAHVAAVAGSSPAKAAALAAELPGAEVCADYRELLAHRTVDAVYIATPPFLHREMLAAVLAAGKSVLCEKPLVMDWAELREIARLRERNPQRVFAGCSSRFQVCPPVRAARELIAAGSIGRLQTVRLAHALGLPPPLARWPVWKRTREQSGGGLLMDWGGYDLDWLFFLLGARFDPVAVMGELDFTGDDGSGLETGYGGQILCRDGLTVTIERRAEQGPRFQRAEIRGVAGGLDLPFMPGEAAPAALRRYHYNESGTLTDEPASAPMCEWGPILAYPVVDFVAALQRDGVVASPFAQQARIHAVLEAWYESAKHGRSVTVSADPEVFPNGVFS